MKLALFMPSFRGGGAERVMLSLADGFVKQGHPVDVVVAQGEGPNAPGPAAGLRVVDLKARRVIAALPILARYLYRESPEAMISALPHANVIAVWARCLASAPTRIVVTEHSTASLFITTAEQRRARLLPFLMRRAYRRADAIVAVSDGVADDLASLLRLDRGRIHRIYNPVITPRMLELAERPVDDPWFAPGQPPVILAAGRLCAPKDFATLVRAFAIVRSRRSARLVILGDGPDRGPLLALAATLGVTADVALPGFVGNPYPRMKAAAVFALSSRREGLPTVLLEAMACGTPVVSADCRSGPDEILERGRHGMLVPVGDVVRFADAIVSALDGSAMPTAAERARSFSLEAALAGYRAILNP